MSSVKIILPFFPVGTMERVDREGEIATAVRSPNKRAVPHLALGPNSLRVHTHTHTHTHTRTPHTNTHTHIHTHTHTQRTLARILSSVPPCRGGPLDLVSHLVCV